MDKEVVRCVFPGGVGYSGVVSTAVLKTNQFLSHRFLPPKDCLKFNLSCCHFGAL